MTGSENPIRGTHRTGRRVSRIRRVVVAIDSFKGSIGSLAAAQAIARGWQAVAPQDEIRLIPFADGGEGTLDAVHAAIPSAERRPVGPVTGPDGRSVPGEWLRLPDGSGVLELAQCSGLPLMADLDPLRATTRGLGEVMAAAVGSGVSRLFVGLGGSASTDGGAGILAALGIRLLDLDGNRLVDGGQALQALHHVDNSNLLAPPRDGVTLLTDVRAPLLGPAGAAAIFGPQKGASADDVTLLESALTIYSRVLGGDPHAAGAGAAGGAAYGLATAWGAHMTSGATWMADIAGLEEAVAEADIVITGEGRLDEQSLRGKLVGEVVRIARRSGTAVGAVVGQSALQPRFWTVSLETISGSVNAAIADPTHWLTAAGSYAAAELTSPATAFGRGNPRRP